MSPKKLSNGVTARKLFFLAAFCGLAFLNLKTAKADMNLDDISSMPDNASGVADWFHSHVPFQKGGHDYWDYIVTIPSDTSVVKYSVHFYNANGVWVTGDGSTMAVVATGDNYTYADYIINVFADGGVYLYNGTPSLVNVNIDGDTTNAMPFSPSDIKYSSQNLIFMQSCSSDWQNITTTDPTEYKMCGSWDSNCSPVSATSTSCGGTTPPVNPPQTLSCSAVFDNIPDWTDPLGMFTGFFKALFNWAGCAFNGLFSTLHDNLVLLSSIIGDYFFHLEESISSTMSGITFDATNLASSIATSVGSMLTSLIIPNSDSAIAIDIKNQLNDSWDSVKSQFADFFTIFNIIHDAPANAQNNVLYNGDFTLYGRTVNITLDPFHQLPIPPIVPTMISLIAYLELGWFLIRNSHRLFD